MAFLKAAWRFLLGVKDVLVLSFLLLFFGMLYAALSMSTGERPHVSRSGALLLDLNGVVVEQPRADDPLALFGGGSSPTREHRLRDIVAALDAARNDSHIKAVVLDLDGFMGGGHVSLGRIGKALDGVRASGKPVLAYATAYEDDGYRLAAHASEIWLNPIGGVAIMGPGGSQLYYKGLLDKLGVTAHIYRVGTYKSAVEPFMLTGASPEAKQASQMLANSLWTNWKADVSRARPKAKVAVYAADPVGLVRAQAGSLSAAARQAGLVDNIGDKQAFNDHVTKLAGTDKAAATGYATVKLKNYIKANQPAKTGQIGVLTVAGEIVDGEAGPGSAGGESIAKLLREALAKHKLKALVVRIDSPGGSVLASEQIRLAIAEAKKAGLPVVASMGDVAASGGYWIATPADKVLAEPSTITGSIGVFGIVPSFRDSLAKIGITSDGVKTTPLSGEPNVLGGFSPEFNALAQLSVEDMYRRFIGLVAQARKLSPQQVNRIAQGRVWDGGAARQLQLVDGFGGLDEAIAEAARLARVNPGDARPFYIEQEPDPFTRFLDNAMAGEGEASLPRDLLARQGWRQGAWAMQALNDARMLGESAGVRASCLECRTYRAPASAPPLGSASWLGWVGKLAD